MGAPLARASLLQASVSFGEHENSILEKVKGLRKTKMGVCLNRVKRYAKVCFGEGFGRDFYEAGRVM